MRLGLFIPAFVKADVYGDVADDVAGGEIQIGGIGDWGEAAVFFGKLQGNPVVGGVVGFVDGVVKGVAFGKAGIQVGEDGLVGAGGGGAENGGVDEFHGGGLLLKKLYCVWVDAAGKYLGTAAVSGAKRF